MELPRFCVDAHIPLKHITQLIHRQGRLSKFFRILELVNTFLNVSPKLSPCDETKARNHFWF